MAVRESNTLTVILFEPHPDDAVLFACYTLLREQPEVVTVFGEDNHRCEEGTDALSRVTGGVIEVWFALSREHVRICRRMRNIDDGEMTVWAPMVEADGHEDHNLVGWAAEDVFGDRCRFYATYKRGHGRTRTDHEVIPEPDWYAKKFKAMSCYVS